MSRKSRRSSARLVQEQALVAGLRKQVKLAAERELSLQRKAASLDKELFEAREQIRKMGRSDVIVAKKFKQYGPRGEKLVFQVMVDSLLMKWEFGERSSRSMTSARQYAEELFFEIRAKMIEGMENVLLGRETRNSARLSKRSVMAIRRTTRSPSSAGWKPSWRIPSSEFTTWPVLTGCVSAKRSRRR